LGVYITIVERERQARSETPAAIQLIDYPEYLHCKFAFFWISEVVVKTLLPVQAHLEGLTASSANRPPSEQFFFSMAKVQALVDSQHSF
jgi:hypothetical protein